MHEVVICFCEVGRLWYFNTVSGPKKGKTLITFIMINNNFQHKNNLRPVGTRTLSLSGLFCPGRLTDDTRWSLSRRDDNPRVRRTEAGLIRHLTPGNIHPNSPVNNGRKYEGFFSCLITIFKLIFNCYTMNVLTWPVYY